MVYPCPCCGHQVFGEPPGSYDICPICGWEDDPVQLLQPHLAELERLPLDHELLYYWRVSSTP